MNTPTGKLDIENPNLLDIWECPKCGSTVYRWGHLHSIQIKCTNRNCDFDISSKIKFTPFYETIDLSEREGIIENSVFAGIVILFVILVYICFL